MKASLTKEDEAAFYNATVKGGTLAGIVGLAVGTAGVYGAQRRYTLIRNLTLPFKVFLAVSTGSFAAIIGADRSGRAYEAAQHPDHDYHSARQAQLEALDANASQKERAMRWASDNRYSIVFGSWVASMGAAFAMVSRSPMNTAQKLVQARVYAQGLTMAVVIASLALEGADMKAARSEGKDGKVTSAIKQKRRLTDADQWMDMVEAEEERMKEREARKI
ncbi:hypothetical protein MBLNU13_g01860t1 [Cladosporium sp. NU13]